MTDDRPRTDLTIAHTILAQLGGRQFLALTGARQFIGRPTSLEFQIPRCGPKGAKINRITVELKDDDTYQVRFHRIHGRKVTTVNRDNGIYNHQLRELVERRTGLTLTMPQIREIAG